LNPAQPSLNVIGGDVYQVKNCRKSEDKLVAAMFFKAMGDAPLIGM